MGANKVAVITAALGGFDKRQAHPELAGCDFYHFDDVNFPPRSKSMTPRLQARIVKTHMWQFVPGYEYYLWVDSSCRLLSKDWFLKQLGTADIAVFKHPHRNTIQAEADYLKFRLGIDCPYITPRYENEDIDGQLAVVEPAQELYASTAFIYRDSPQIRRAMQDWWYNISRWHSIDQLSLPFVLFENACAVNVIPDNYEKNPGIEYVRNK